MARRYALDVIATLRRTLEFEHQTNRNVVAAYQKASPTRRRNMMRGIENAGHVINAAVEDLAQALRQTHRYS